jgi:hypothetical protein
MTQKAINFQQKFKLLDEQWSPKVIAEMNDYQFEPRGVLNTGEDAGERTAENDIWI